MSDDESLIYQIKWSVSGSEKKSVSWLTNAIKTEEKNIKALVAAGAKQYVLVTNVASTGGKRGSFDAPDRELQALSKTYGVAMQCKWRETGDSCSEERRVGKECVSTIRFRCAAKHYIKRTRFRICITHV